MTIRVGINGFGRIGRQVVRAATEGNGELEIVAVNDLADPATLAHLLRYDSVHGPMRPAVERRGDTIVVDGAPIRVLSHHEPARLPWKDLDVDVVLESTGRFTDASDARRHLDAGARKVLVSAVSRGADVTVVMGVNHDRYDPANDHVVSNASCTTNCLVPMVKVVRDNFGFVRGSMVTVHSYTNDQNILDAPHRDLRRARAAALSIIPTTTGAAQATSLVIPELEGRIDGVSYRVPTADVSIADLTAVVERAVTIREVNEAFAAAARTAPLQGILRYSEEELVSRDLTGDPHSCVIDAKSTSVVDGTLVRVAAWYDNEWGYACRCVDLLRLIGGQLE